MLTERLPPLAVRLDKDKTESRISPSVIGADSVVPDRPMIVLARDTTTEMRVLVTAPFAEKAEKSVPVKFRITDIGLGEVAAATDHFVLP